jgi:alkyl hydroperoxide reductase subunit AhpF
MVERLLNEQVAGQVKQIFERLNHPVHVLLFSSQSACETCEDTQQLLTEVITISDKLSLEVLDLGKNQETASKYRVDKAPGIVLLGKDGNHLVDYGVRLFGIPSGHEFSTLIHDLILVSGRDSQLSPKTREYLSGLKEPVHLQVFVTPT